MPRPRPRVASCIGQPRYSGQPGCGLAFRQRVHGGAPITAPVAGRDLEPAAAWHRPYRGSASALAIGTPILLNATPEPRRPASACPHLPLPHAPHNPKVAGSNPAPDDLCGRPANESSDAWLVAAVRGQGAWDRCRRPQGAEPHGLEYLQCRARLALRRRFRATPRTGPGC
jgi:hypothetical protein